MDENSCAMESTNGHPDPWASIYEEYGQALRQYFAACLNHPEDADDLVQSVFAKLVQRQHIPADPRTYIYAAARNHLHSYWREKKRRDRQTASLLLEQKDVRAGVSPAIDPYEQLHREEERQAIGQALKVLPATLACALGLRIIHGLSLREAAQEAGCSPDVMKKRLQRAKRFLLVSYERISEGDTRC